MSTGAVPIFHEAGGFQGSEAKQSRPPATAMKILRLSNKQRSLLFAKMVMVVSSTFPEACSTQAPTRRLIGPAWRRRQSSSCHQSVAVVRGVAGAFGENAAIMRAAALVVNR